MVPIPYYDEERMTHVSAGDGYGVVYTVRLQVVGRPRTSFPVVQCVDVGPSCDDKADLAAAKKAKPEPYWARFQKRDTRGHKHNARRR